MHDGSPTYNTLMVTELLGKTEFRRLDMGSNALAG
jgi:hypothetical protein